MTDPAVPEDLEDVPPAEVVEADLDYTAPVDTTARQRRGPRAARATKAENLPPRPSLGEVLAAMHAVYVKNPAAAVRSQTFIKMLHKYLADDLNSRLTDWAKSEKIEVKEEGTIYGSHKPKDADVAIIHPNNGVLVSIGVRSQMSSVGKNVLEYYQGIIGECISLQDRFPMAVYGYVYLHPLLSKKTQTIGGRKEWVDEHPDFHRYARMYEAITGRAGTLYRDIRGVYDQFAYLAVDFTQLPVPVVRDDIVQASVPLARADLRISTFVDRVVNTFKERNLWIDLFE